MITFLKIQSDMNGPLWLIFLMTYINVSVFTCLSCGFSISATCSHQPQVTKVRLLYVLHLFAFTIILQHWPVLLKAIFEDVWSFSANTIMDKLMVCYRSRPQPLVMYYIWAASNIPLTKLERLAWIRALSASFVLLNRAWWKKDTWVRRWAIVSAL